MKVDPPNICSPLDKRWTKPVGKGGVNPALKHKALAAVEAEQTAITKGEQSNDG